MIREGIDRIVELSDQARGVFTVHDEPFAWTNGTLSHVPPPKVFAPDALKVYTLTALREYLAANIDGLDPIGHMIHVAAPTRVEVVSGPEGARKERLVRLVAEWNPGAFGFGQFAGVEDAVIALQARYTDSPDRARALALIGNLQDETVSTNVDDGVTQRVAAKKGVASVAQVEVRNPFLLAPMRSFTEIDQPVSPFVLRVRRGHAGPEVALFEADGGAWKIDAVQRIAAWITAANAATGYAVIA